MDPQQKTPESAPETPPIDEFANAFIEAVNSDEPGTVETPPKPAAAPAAAPPAAPAAAPAAAPETPPVETGAAEADEAAAAGADAEIVEKGVKTPEIEAPEAKMARLEAENSALRAPKQPETAPPEAPERGEKQPETGEKPPETPPPGPTWYEFAPEEKAAIEQFKKDWPDIAAANEVLVKQAAFNAVEYVFDVMRKQILPRMKQYEEMSEVMAERLTLDVLQKAHPDYDAIYGDIVTWVDTLPAAFKHGAKQVMQSGSPDEVAELIATFKETRGAVKAAVPAPKAATELSAAAKQAAGKLRVVGSKRSTPIAGADPNDFDAAWAEATASG